MGAKLAQLVRVEAELVVWRVQSGGTARLAARIMSRRTHTEVLDFRVLQVSLKPGFYPPAKCVVIALA
jgi:hypothetical protein